MHQLCITLLIVSFLQYQVQGVSHSRKKIRHMSSEMLPDPEEHINTLQKRRLHNHKKIIRFEDGLISPTFNYTLPRIVPICKNSTFCEEVPDYPKNMIRVALKMNTDLKYFATIDELVDATPIDQRIGSTETNICHSRETVIFPKSAENNQRQWRFIVNDKNFPQGVRVEICVNEDSSCQIVEGFAYGYATYCKQKYIYRQLACVSPDGSLSPDSFKLPSSCCCHAEFVGHQNQRRAFTSRLQEKNSFKEK